MSNLTKNLYTLISQGKITKSAAAKQLGISPRTLGRWIDKYENTTKQSPHVGSEMVIDETGDLVDNHEHPQENQNTYSVTLTSNAITIFEIGDGALVDTHVINKDNQNFQTAYNLIAENAASQDSIASALLLSSQKKQIKELSLGCLEYNQKTHNLCFSHTDENGNEIKINFPTTLKNRLVESIQSGENQHLVNFANRLALNPSNRVVSELYDFLQAGDIEIDSDGYVICFKKVKQDYKDVHSGTFDNSVGKIISMPRNQVEDDPRKTCSAGLHVCSSAYLSHFHGARVMKCKVDPADFVSVPYDYYSNDAGSVKAKARVCRYEVIGEVE